MTNYFKCPKCKSVNLEEILNDDYMKIIHLHCLECNYQFHIPKDD